jgi:hypothetical protein
VHRNKGDASSETAARVGEDREVVIHATQPLPAEIVSDRRDTWQKRVVFLSFILIFLFVLINDRVEGALNHRLLKEASVQRLELLHSQAQLLEKLNQEHDRGTREAQTIADLYQIILKEEALLKKAGFTDKQIQAAVVGTGAPGDNHNGGGGGHPKSQPSSRPSRSPSPSPSPSPTPCTLHDPLTGRCIVP